MSVFRIGRRHFLQGAGGAALAIPFLPSLEKNARAAVTIPPRYFYIATGHGGCWDQNFFPSNTSFGNTIAVPGVAGHMVSSGSLTATTSGAKTVLSPVLTASTTAFAGLVPKMNVLQGLDVPCYMSHNTGLLGNYARNDNNGGDGVALTALGARPSIDQVMSASSSFYTSAILASTKSQVMVMGQGGYSWQAATPGNPGSAVSGVNNGQDALSLFQSMFGTKPAGSTPKAARKSIIDLVLGSYSSLMNGSSRLSAADKVRLGQHIEMLNALEQSLTATLACTTTPAAPGSNDAVPAQAYADVVAAAFACGASRIGVYGFGDTTQFSPTWKATGKPDSDWHGDAAHSWFTDVGQTYLRESYQGFFEQVFVYLAAKLNGMTDADGKTVLDNSLLVWAQECSMETHAQLGIQTATFGSAGGRLNTGLHCDYRHQNDPAGARKPADGQTPASSSAITSYTTWPGLLWEQWLATQLVVMGIPNNEWEIWSDAGGGKQKGYGTPYCQTGTYFAKHYVPNNPSWSAGVPPMSASPYWSNASTPLPFLTK